MYVYIHIYVRKTLQPKLNTLSQNNQPLRANRPHITLLRGYCVGEFIVYLRKLLVGKQKYNTALGKLNPYSPTTDPLASVLTTTLNPKP